MALCPRCKGRGRLWPLGLMALSLLREGMYVFA
jgi:hypothetical protein